MTRALPNVFGPWWIILAGAVVVGAILTRRVRILLVLAACFLTGFLMFPRLFIGNIYYEVENLLFLAAMVGVVTAALAATRWWFLGCLLVLGTMGLQAWTLAAGTYGHQFFDDLKKHPYYLAGVRLKEVTPADSVVVVFGTDWGSDIPLISQRRAIMAANWATVPVLEDILFTNREKWLGGRPIGAVVDCNVFDKQATKDQVVPIRDRLLAEMTSPVETVSGPVGNGSVPEPSCTMKFAAPPA